MPPRAQSAQKKASFLRGLTPDRVLFATADSADTGSWVKLEMYDPRLIPRDASVRLAPSFSMMCLICPFTVSEMVAYDVVV